MQLPNAFEGNKWMSEEGPNVVKYDPKEPPVAIFARFRGTILPLVFSSQIFYGLLAVHVVLLTINFWIVPLQPMDTEIVVGLPATMLLFLVVFYNGNCYDRYFELWGHTCGVFSIVHAWVQQTSFILEDMEAVASSESKKQSKDRSFVTTNGLPMKRAAWRATRRILSSM